MQMPHSSAMANPDDVPRGLYEELLGSSWLQLSAPVRLAHATGPRMRARGRLRIGHGRSRCARVLARLARLPRASDDAETQLVVTSLPGVERWCRSFDGRCLDTRQYRAGKGELAERFGLLELRFRLEVVEGSLLFHQTQAALVLASVRVRLPASWAPQVDAREEPVGAHRIRVHVRVVVPSLGPLLTYDGTIDIQPAGA